jgi:hypothetical protein
LVHLLHHREEPWEEALDGAKEPEALDGAKEPEVLEGAKEPEVLVGTIEEPEVLVGTIEEPEVLEGWRRRHRWGQRRRGRLRRLFS